MPQRNSSSRNSSSTGGQSQPARPRKAPSEPQEPKIVVIGGGTGSFTILSGLKLYPCSLTAVVNMMDSGGSSGRLRDEFGVLPPGDLRQCLLALSPDDHAGMVLRQLFNYRFNKGNGLGGHNFGNLFLTVLTEVTGSTEAAIQEMGRLLSIKGRVLPVTLTDAHLHARLRNGKVIVGEANIDRRQLDLEVAIERVYLEPKAAIHASTAAALAEADAIVIGPGDLYTSIVPNLLVEGVAEAIRKSRAKRVYVCNLMTKPGESDGFKASDFISTIQTYLGSTEVPEYVLINSEKLPPETQKRYAGEGSDPVVHDEAACRKLVANVVSAPLVAVGSFVRHDPRRLAEAVLALI